MMNPRRHIVFLDEEILMMRWRQRRRKRNIFFSASTSAAAENGSRIRRGYLCLAASNDLANLPKELHYIIFTPIFKRKPKTLIKDSSNCRVRKKKLASNETYMMDGNLWDDQEGGRNRRKRRRICDKIIIIGFEVEV